MKTGARIAVGVGIGYLLGRTKKMRLALTLAAAGATGRAGTSPSSLLRGGLKQLGSIPELGKLTDVARNELLTAARSAAVSAASQRIESLSERIQDRHGDESDDADDADETQDTDEAQDADDADEAQDAEPEPPKRRRTNGAAARSRRSRSTSDPSPVRRASGR